MSKYILLAVACLLISPLLRASDAAEQQEAVKKLEEAVSKTNIFDLPSFQMTASVQVENQGEQLEGSYRLLWNGREQWREEITIPGYTELQIGGKGTVWVQRSTDFLPLRIYQLHAALGFWSSAGADPGYSGYLVRVGITPTDHVKKVHSRKQHGNKLTCVEVEHEPGFSSELCVNDNTGTLVRGTFYEEHDFQPVGGKIFPRSLSFVDSGKTVVKISISNLVASADFPPNSFTPGTGVAAEAGCMNPTPYREIKKVAPQYPPALRQQRIQGMAAFDVSITTDGVPRIRRMVASSNPAFEKSTETAIAAWRYEPATCDGKPVEVETVLHMRYTLSP
jgi:TonB family protein